MLRFGVYMLRFSPFRCFYEPVIMNEKLITHFGKQQQQALLELGEPLLVCLHK